MPTLAEITFGIKFEIDDRELSEAEKKAKETAEKINKSWQDVTSSVKTAGLAIAGAATAMFLLGERAAAAGAAIDDVTKRAGVGAREHQRLAFALEQSGGSTEGLASSYKFLSKAIVDARTGSGPAAAAFTKLGISTKKLEAASNVEARFQILAEAFGKVDDQALKTDLALQVLGRGGIELLPLFDEGADGIGRMGDEAERLGLVMSESAIKAAADFDDQLQKTKAQITAVTNEIGIDLLPKLGELVKNWDKVALAVGSFGVAIGGLKLAQLPSQIGLAANSMLALATRTAGATTAALGLGVALGTALDSALGLSDALAGVQNTVGKREGTAALSDLTPEDRARQQELVKNVTQLEGLESATGGLDPRLRAELDAGRSELAQINQRGLKRGTARQTALKQIETTGASERKRINAVNFTKLRVGVTDLLDPVRGTRALDAVGRFAGNTAYGAVGKAIGVTIVDELDRKDKKKKGGTKTKVVDVSAFDALAGADLRATGARVGASGKAITAAILAGATSLNAGDSEGVARKAALGSLGSSVGRDLTTKTHDPLLSSIFGENVPDIELSSLARGADPQVLISTINNTFNFDIDQDIDGAGDPAAVGDAIAVGLRTVFQGAIEANTKTAKVGFAR